MPAAKPALRFFGVQAPPVREDPPVKESPRAAVMERAAKSIKHANELLNLVTHELTEGDLDLADLIVPAR